VDRVGRAGAVVPLAIIVFFAVLDMAADPPRIVFGMVVIAPLLAASLLGRRATVLYAVLAFAVAGLLGIYDEQYTADAWPIQAARLFGVALGGLIAFAACTARLEREVQVQRLSAEAALAHAQASDAEGMAGLAEWLQRSLLTDLPPIPDVEVVARYVPAADHVKIGGDWYDLFPAPGGRMLMVVGDVAGHDAPATALMAQLRSVLRGIGQVLTGSPATLLTAMDRAMNTLLFNGLATVILAEITRDIARDDQPLVVRWSNAGHPPPLLINNDGTTQLLEYDPDLLLGVDPDTHRADHEWVLHSGDTIVLFTDGLIEGHGGSIDEGLHRVQCIGVSEAQAPLEKLCEALLTRRCDQPDDDVVVLALRARPVGTWL
jgi:phosphoserine phosphatase RsbU/P